MKFKFLGLLSLIGLTISLSSCNIKFVTSFENINTQTSEGETGGETGKDTPIEDEDPVIVNTFYAYNDFSRFEKSKECQSLYNDIVAACNTFAESKKDIVAEPIDISGDSQEPQSFYVIDRVNFSKYNLTAKEAISVWRGVGLDHPEYYFLSGTILTSSDGTNNYLTLTLTSDYKDYSVRNEINTSISSFVNELNDQIIGTNNQGDKVKIINDFIVAKSDYAKKLDGTPETAEWAHNIVGIPTKGKGVCEAYAKLFNLLCRAFDLESILVIGDGITSSGTEAHAWNYVKIDSKWYPIDVTWNDTTKTSNYFLTSASKFLTDHKAEQTNSLDDTVNYLYVLPTLSETAYK